VILLVIIARILSKDIPYCKDFPFWVKSALSSGPPRDQFLYRSRTRLV